MFDKEALEYLRETAGIKVHEIKGKTFYNSPEGHMTEVKEPVILPGARVNVKSLDSLTDWVKDHKTEIEYLKIDPLEILAFTCLNGSLERSIPLISQPIDSPIVWGEWMGQQDFIIFLKTKFIMTEDLDYLIKLVSVIKEEESRKLVDNGITQKITISTGVELENTIVKNMLKLRPYRTYQEVEQPESEFFFRINRGMNFALFETDGGRWKHTANESIKEYLRKEIPDVKMLS